ncbi:hypothetical protein OUZ56_030349 [Daphnia magna]|uniref:Uncharacterized protein n=1 Tax=Daphnia magna TaxID=35525 RepID=A0ABQ9ZSB7_9CRUS|nr:hypothetical protein OUZ56_030349 [Daphnia magna]
MTRTRTHAKFNKKSMQINRWRCGVETGGPTIYRRGQCDFDTKGPSPPPLHFQKREQEELQVIEDELLGSVTSMNRKLLPNKNLSLLFPYLKLHLE